MNKSRFAANIKVFSLQIYDLIKELQNYIKTHYADEIAAHLLLNQSFEVYITSEDFSVYTPVLSKYLLSDLGILGLKIIFGAYVETKRYLVVESSYLEYSYLLCYSKFNSAYGHVKLEGINGVEVAKVSNHCGKTVLHLRYPQGDKVSYAITEKKVDTVICHGNHSCFDLLNTHGIYAAKLVYKPNRFDWSNLRPIINIYKQDDLVAHIEPILDNVGQFSKLVFDFSNLRCKSSWITDFLNSYTDEDIQSVLRYKNSKIQVILSKDMPTLDTSQIRRLDIFTLK